MITRKAQPVNTYPQTWTGLTLGSLCPMSREELCNVVDKITQSISSLYRQLLYWHPSHLPRSQVLSSSLSTSWLKTVSCGEAYHHFHSLPPHLFPALALMRGWQSGSTCQPIRAASFYWLTNDYVNVGLTLKMCLWGWFGLWFDTDCWGLGFLYCVTVTMKISSSILWLLFWKCL